MARDGLGSREQKRVREAAEERVAPVEERTGAVEQRAGRVEEANGFQGEALSAHNDLLQTHSAQIAQGVDADARQNERLAGYNPGFFNVNAGDFRDYFHGLGALPTRLLVLVAVAGEFYHVDAVAGVSVSIVNDNKVRVVNGDTVTRSVRVTAGI